ncbi:putative gp17 [Burkholderia multivorans]|uniref:membrane protein n=1 Tax=Burkholderia multivorans TaxID=87883 RepID=UPI00050ED0DF|nr:membrane protein [Burkholderia multivorans]KGC06124.1 putative gp17 [Burkholderia multivorans]
MSDRSLRLEVVLKALDQASRPIREITGRNRALVKDLRDTRARLKELGDTQKRIGEFRELRRGMQETEAKARAAQERVRQLAQQMKAAESPTRALTREHQQAVRAAKALAAQLDQERQRLDGVRSSLAASGVSTRNLVEHQRALRSSIAETNTTLTEHARRLDAMNNRQQRIAAARTKMGAMRGAAAEMAIGGYAARATGQHILADLREPLAEAKKIQNERGRILGLGLGEHATQDAERYVRAMKTPGVAIADNMTLMRDAMSIFADEHHAQMVMPTLAKMKFANEAMFGADQGHENEEKFMNMLKVIELRGGTKSEAAFIKEANMVQQVLTATGGRVGGDEWRNFIQTGKVAAKQMRQDAFYYQMEPLIQEMGGHAAGTGVQAAYSNLMQGKTTVRAAKRLVELGLVDKKSVEYNAIGNVKRIKPGALIGGNLFNASPFEWMEKVLLPKLKAKGITSDAKILEEFSTIMTNGNGANLFATMYMQREQIHKNERLNRGAYGIDQLHALGQQQTEGKELIALEKVRNLRTVIGEQVLPVYNRALELTTSVLERLLGFAKEYPKFTRAVATGAAGLGVLLAVLGTLTITLAAVLGPLAIVRFSMSMLGIQGGVLVRALGAIARTLLFVGRVALTSPIGIVIAGIALAALLIVRYWEPIKAFFSGFWQGLADGLKPLAPLVSQAFGILGAAFAPLKPLFVWLMGAAKGVWDWLTRLLPPVDASKESLDAATGAGRAFGAWLADIIRGLADASTRFAEFGSNLMSGLVDGITNGLGAVKTAIQRAGDSVVSWFKERLGIHSPSRVFAALGGFTMAGLEQGLRNGQDGPLATVRELGKRIVAAGAGIGLTGAAIAGSAPLSVDNRPPLIAATAARAPASAPAPITINVYASPGMDANALAQKVLQVMRQEQAAQAARERSRLRDRD